MTTVGAEFPVLESTDCRYVGGLSAHDAGLPSQNDRNTQPIRDIAEAVGRRLELPVKSIGPDEAQAFFGWLAMFAGRDVPASSEQTRKKLGWEPIGPGLIADLENLHVTEG